MNQAIINRFWSKVEKTEGCWIWKASAHKNGYGQFVITHGRNVLAHRFAYEVTHGPIPDDRRWCVCHTCDNPICVNPTHLWLGTDADNAQDRMRKGRSSSSVGENNKQAKLTTEQVLTMRKMHSEGNHSIGALARIFGVNQALASRIVNRLRWKHI